MGRTHASGFGGNSLVVPLSRTVFAMWTVLAAVLVLNVYRAVTQSLTIDEAFTYKDFVAAPWEEARHHVDPNNHVLNTLLEKVTVDWWGPSEWAIRLPSLLGGFIYMAAALGLVNLLWGGAGTSIVIFCALILNPIVLDYMSAARGYSLALGLQFCAIFLMAHVCLKPGTKIVEACLHAAIGVAMGLSATANLAFLIPNAIVTVLFLAAPWISGRKVDSEQAGLNVAMLLATAGVTFGELMFGTFEGANVSTFVIGEASAARSIHILFVKSFQYPTVAGGKLLAPLLALVTGPILIACLLGAVIFFWKSGVPGKREALLLFPLTLAGSLIALVALHMIIGLPYPYERTGIYLLPLMTLTVACAMRVRWKILSGAALLFLCAVTVQYALELKSGWYEEWRFDAGTKRVMQELMRVHEANPVPGRMGISWVYEDTATYYARMWHLDWLAPLTRDDPQSRDFDYYYLQEEDQPLVARRGLVILYRDPVSKAVLARRQ